MQNGGLVLPILKGEEPSVTQTTTKRYKQNQHVSKMSVDSNFAFTSYAGLCVLVWLHGLLYLIKSRIYKTLWEKLLLFHKEMFSG